MGGQRRPDALDFLKNLEGYFMSKKQNIVALFSLLTLFLVACGSEQATTNPSSTTLPLVTTAAANKTAAIKPSPTATLPPTATPTPTIQPSPTLMIGEDITPPKAKGWLELRRTNQPSQSSQQEIMQTLYKRGLNYAFGNSSGITLTATFGVTTFEKGHPKCISYDNRISCTTTSPTVKPHINRPVWVFIYNGFPYTGSGQPCYTYTTYEVFIIDDQTREILATYLNYDSAIVLTPTPDPARRQLPATIIPTPAKVGDEFNYSYLKQHFSLVLRRVAEQPKHSLKEVQEVIYANGNSYAFGGEYKSHILNVNALYGFGTTTGLIEGKNALLAWVIDYGNMPNPAGPGGCYGDGPKLDYHELYYVDAETLKSIFQASYEIPLP